MKKEELMRKAIELSIENVANGGGPFGAVIAKDGEIIATGVNRVTSQCDPTAHAEVSAIRAAATKLGTFNLSGCEIYTSCEPCPMCLGAIYWARLDKMYYANNKTDAKNIGFDDSFIYDELSLKPSARKLPSEILLAEEAIKAFQQWTEKSDIKEDIYSYFCNANPKKYIFISLNKKIMKNFFDIKGKVIVITGGCGILGKNIANYLAEQGAKIVVLVLHKNTFHHSL